ncbi:MAG: type II toxin-antitoxin system death-on-curing family toxin [Acidobacteria bacterium]|nr:MAG: type II toxin-antitoxin system death-on-curing family toxin [Acidobacteriota bacterium]
MEQPLWIQANIVPAIHSRQLAEHGGASGVRDQGLLEAALDAPKNRWLYENCGIEELAACYAYHLVMNHPFIDGNKRTAWVCMRLFLKLNGLDIEADRQEKVRTMLDLSAGRMELKELAAWILSKTRRTK